MNPDEESQPKGGAEVEALVQRIALDPDARALRHQVADHLAESLSTAGMHMVAIGDIIGDGRRTGSSPRGHGNDSLVAVGAVCLAAGELLVSIESLLASGRSYAAAALARQMVELEYLAWTFDTDHEDARTWLNSSDYDRRRLWQPRHLRDRSSGRFSAEDYSQHCELGGHPTPNGFDKFLGGQAEAAGELMLSDTLGHTARLWRSIASSAEGASHVDIAAVDEHLAQWRAADALPRTLEVIAAAVRP